MIYGIHYNVSRRYMVSHISKPPLNAIHQFVASVIFRKVVKDCYLSYQNGRIMVTLLGIGYFTIELVSCTLWDEVNCNVSAYDAKGGYGFHRVLLVETIRLAHQLFRIPYSFIPEKSLNSRFALTVKSLQRSVEFFR